MYNMTQQHALVQRQQQDSLVHIDATRRAQNITENVKQTVDAMNLPT